MEFKLWDHQKQGIENARGKPGYAFFYQPGTGKTATLIRTICDRMNADKRMLRVLIFSPPMVVPQFKEEWGRFSKIDPKSIVTLQGPQTKRVGRFNLFGYDAVTQKARPAIFITNYEALLMKDLFEHFRHWAPEMIAWDESHFIKSPQSQRSKLADLLANPPKQKRPISLLSTGTPILNSPMDIFQQFKVMLGGWPLLAYFEYLGDTRFLITNFYHFRAKYFRDRNVGMAKSKYFPKWETMTLAKDGFDALGEIQSIIDKCGMVVRKEDCLDLPGELSVIRTVGLTPEQNRVYQEMKSDLISYVGGGACVATLALTKALRLLQITSGYAATTDGQEMSSKDFSGTQKEEVLRELLETLTPGSKVLVWAVWRQNYATIRRVCTELKIPYLEIHGEISDKEKLANVEIFKKDPQYRVLLGHPGSGGIGLNLTCAPYSIFYSRTFSLGQYIQARARNYRGGQNQKVTHYDIVVGNTIDSLVLEKLAQKIELGDALIGDLAKELASQI